MRKWVRMGQWPAIIEAQAKSGQGVNEFCEANDICRTSFFKWRRQLKKPAEPSGFKRLVVASPRAEIELREQEDLTGLRILVPNGYKVEANGCGMEDLRRALEMVGRL
jgi:transposase-like protein